MCLMTFLLSTVGPKGKGDQPEDNYKLCNPSSNIKLHQYFNNYVSVVNNCFSFSPLLSVTFDPPSRVRRSEDDEDRYRNVEQFNY